MKFSIKSGIFTDKEISPNDIAVSGSDRDLTWSELEAATIEVEAELTRLGVRPGHPVAIVGHKESNFISSICACLKLNCPYIPIDDAYPQQRIDSIISIAKPFCVVDLRERQIKLNPIVQEIDPQIAYIIFTSGTTGEPKGVQILRESVCSLLNWMEEDFQLEGNAIFMNQALFSFDLSVYELMYFLNFGKAIVLNSREKISDQNEFFHRLKKYQVNTWVSTPSFAWSQSLSEHFHSSFIDLKTFLFCGETLPFKVVKKIRKSFPKARILNTYGPTEATVATTLIEITDDIIERYPGSLPIGLPKKGTLVYPDHNGEICIEGPNVMKGYLNNPVLNEKKMYSQNGTRCFRTGDLGYIQEGLLFCKGRIDDQIKFHGYRIELQEIDDALSMLNFISNASTIAIKREHDVVRLVSFIKRSLVMGIGSFEIVEALKKSLPEYMVPNEFIEIEDFPLNDNHKIDKKKLHDMYKSEDLKKVT